LYLKEGSWADFLQENATLWPEILIVSQVEVHREDNSKRWLPRRLPVNH
jgi:hypothetical protein